MGTPLEGGSSLLDPPAKARRGSRSRPIPVEDTPVKTPPAPAANRFLPVALLVGLAAGLAFIAFKGLESSGSEEVSAGALVSGGGSSSDGSQVELLAVQSAERFEVREAAPLGADSVAGLQVAGQVVDDLGFALRDVRVLRLDARSERAVGEELTFADVQGRFSVVVPAHEGVGLAFRHAGFQDVVFDHAALRAAAGAPLEVVMRRGGELRGLLMDGVGRPIEGARLSLAREPERFGTLADPSFEEVGLTGADGAFRLAPIAFGEQVLRFTKEGYFATNIAFKVSPLDADEVRTFELRSLGTLRGRVVPYEVASGGRHQALASVWHTEAGRGVSSVEEFITTRSVELAADGSFAIDGLPTALQSDATWSCEVQVFSDLQRSIPLTEIERIADLEGEVLLAPLLRGLVKVRARDAVTGEALAAFQAAAEYRHPDHPEWGRSRAAAEDGVALVEVPIVHGFAEVTPSVELAGYATAVLASGLRMTEGETREVEVEALPLVRLQATVIDHTNGDPLGLGQVRLAMRESSLTYGTVPLRVRAETDSSGTVELEICPTSVYTVEVRREGFQDLAYGTIGPFAGGEDVALTLGLEAAGSLLVAFEKQQGSDAGLGVLLRGENPGEAAGVWTQHVADEGEELRIQGLAPGLYEIQPALALGGPLLHAQQVRVEPGACTEVWLERPPTAMLEALVLCEGSPVSEAFVELRDPHAGGAALRAETNASGSARLSGVLPGSYDLQITAPGESLWIRRMVELEAGANRLLIEAERRPIGVDVVGVRPGFEGRVFLGVVGPHHVERALERLSTRNPRLRAGQEASWAGSLGLRGIFDPERLTGPTAELEVSDGEGVVVLAATLDTEGRLAQVGLAELEPGAAWAVVELGASTPVDLVAPAQSACDERNVVRFEVELQGYELEVPLEFLCTRPGVLGALPALPLATRWVQQCKHLDGASRMASDSSGIELY